METFEKLRSYVLAQHRMTQDNIYHGLFTISRESGNRGQKRRPERTGFKNGRRGILAKTN